MVRMDLMIHCLTGASVVPQLFRFDRYNRCIVLSHG